MHTCTREEQEKHFPWIRQYKTKKWETVELIYTGEEHRTLQARLSALVTQGVTVCGAGSQVSENLFSLNGSVGDLFFYDLEQTEGMGLKECYHAEYGILTAEWREYPEGSIVLISVNGLYYEEGDRRKPEQPPTCLVGVAPYAPTVEKDGEALMLAREELAKGVSEEEVENLLWKAGDYSAYQAAHIIQMAKQSLTSP